MLQAFGNAIPEPGAHHLAQLDLYADPPPWYDEAVYGYLWPTGDEKKDRAEGNHEAIGYLQRHCREFNQAELLVIAAPVWNQSIPAILKAWIDLIIAPNQTYRFSNDGIEPLHRIRRMVYLISSGGREERVNADNHFLAIHLAPFSYIGIPEIDVIWADGQEPALFEDHTLRLQQAIDKTVQLARKLTG